MKFELIIGAIGYFASAETGEWLKCSAGEKRSSTIKRNHCLKVSTEY